MKDRTTKRPFLSEFLTGINAGDTMMLSRAITLIESQLPSDRELAKQLLDELNLTDSQSLRIGITGVPGVGKSTFIEAFGNLITKQQKKVAILAVDPTSSVSQGSILGDKTRMENLAMNPLAYIRPSPAGRHLGGVANKTRETILLCEAAGFDTIIVETVGVGQSETLVHGMVDFFLLLMIPGAGDELQGIKRGIIEMADALVINKADGDLKQSAKTAKKAYQNALHLYPPRSTGWVVPVQTCSALENAGIDEVWNMIQRYFELHSITKILSRKRANQNIEWFNQMIQGQLMERFLAQPDTNKTLEALRQKISDGELSVRHALDLLFES